MNMITLTNIVILVATFSITACASDPAPQRDPYNDADSQRSRAGQAQGEMSKGTSK